jgi:hypothetical protein
MTLVLRPGESIADLTGPEGSCPACAGPLRKWGHGRWRVRREGSGESRFRPDRVRCGRCGVTHVVLPADGLVRRRDAISVVGRAWRSFARGAGARRVADQLGLPMETVRGWLRRLRRLTRLMYGPERGGPGALRLGLADAESAAHRAGWHGEIDLWRFVAYRSQGRLLANTS